MWRKLSVFVLIFAFVGVACASISDDAGAGDASCLGPACHSLDGGRDQYVADIQLPDGALEDGKISSNPLCGTGCAPDDPAACSDLPSPEGGEVDASATDAGPDDATTDALPGLSEAGPAPLYGCFVSADSQAKPVASCQPAGGGATGAPCVHGSDCAPGFACVGDGNAAQCRPFCCASPASCEKGTWCAERPLKGPPGSPVQLVPVCVQADDCNLGEPYPCEPNRQCKCEPGTACMVVREGTTACVPPGSGKAGEPCPCAAGHVCSKASGTCLKICSVDSAEPECGSGKCQAVGYMPEDQGYGVCALGGTDGGY